MLRKDKNYTKRVGHTRLAAIRVDNIDDSLEWFGNYTPSGETPIILMPERSSCAPYIYIPEGTFAIITKHGQFQEVWREGGMHWCLPWTRIQYLITQQNIIYDMVVKSCPTFDNVFIEIDIGVVFRCKDDEESIKNFAYNISINQLNEQLEAALTERLRVLVRGKTHLEVYTIRRDHTKEMLEFLNKMFASKGLEFSRIIITNVKLPPDIAKPLDYKAQYGSMNEYEKTRHEFDIRLLNDDREIELIKQRKIQERTQVGSLFQVEVKKQEREYHVIQADARKQVSEVNERGVAEQKRIDADSEFQAQEIMSQTKIMIAKMKAEGQAQANILKTEADAYEATRNAEVISEVAEKNAETIKVEGGAEAELKVVLGSRRLYEYLNHKLNVIKALGNNPNFKIFGNQSDKVISQMAAYRLLQNDGKF